MSAGKYKLDDGREVTMSDLGRCPFCGGGIGASAEDSATLHKQPMCAKFKELEPLDFLRAVRAERRKQGWKEPS